MADQNSNSWPLSACCADVLHWNSGAADNAVAAWMKCLRFCCERADMSESCNLTVCSSRYQMELDNMIVNGRDFSVNRTVPRQDRCQ